MLIGQYFLDLMTKTIFYRAEKCCLGNNSETSLLALLSNSYCEVLNIYEGSGETGNGLKIAKERESEKMSLHLHHGFSSLFSKHIVLK